jgi:hypothetical protein
MSSYVSNFKKFIKTKEKRVAEQENQMDSQNQQQTQAQPAPQNTAVDADPGVQAALAKEIDIRNQIAALQQQLVAAQNELNNARAAAAQKMTTQV